MSNGVAADQRQASMPASLMPTQAANASQSSARMNALQARIATVLSASHSDHEISEALQLLDPRGIENTADTRRNLRLELQHESIASNGRIVQDFGAVAEQLKRVGSALDGLNKTFADIRSHVAAAKRETGPVLDEYKALVEQRGRTDIKQKLLNAFNAHFAMTDAEHKALTSSAEPVDDAFYAALARTKQIHSDCKVLLGSEDQTLGLELLERSSNDLNSAFQKLARWTQRELKTIDLENAQVSTAIRKAFRFLAERPALFESCLDFFAESRERSLSDAFYAALTGNAVSSKAAASVPSKAIELNAHEPLRYVSDMLAWLHAATVGEKEALHNLFMSDAEEISKSLKMGRESQPWLHADDPLDGDGTVFDGKKALNELVDRDLSGVLRQLRQRVEQTVRSHEDAVLAYQIANLALFYKSIFAGLVGSESSVEAVLGPTAAMATEQFRIITRDHITSLHGEIENLPTDLSPPEFLLEALDTLRKLMKSYDTSFAANVTSEERIAGFEVVLTEALDPYLAGCENIGRRVGQPDNAIFALNCLAASRAAMLGSSYVGSRLESIEDSMARARAGLIEDVREWLINESGLDDTFEELRPLIEAGSIPTTEEIRNIPQLEVETLSETAQMLDAFLPTSSEDARAHIRHLQDKRLAREVCEEAADLFVEEFESLERLLADIDAATVAASVEEEPVLLRDIFPRTSEEIRVLLS